MSLEGVHMAVERCNQLAKDTQAEIDELMVELPKDINLNSPKQLNKWLYDDLGLAVPPIKGGSKNPVPNTKLDQNATEVAILHLAKEFPLLHKLAKVKKLTRRAQFLEKLPTHIMPDGRIHSKFGASTETGRQACSSPNLQQLEEFIRYPFTAPKGKKLIVFDYSALEFVIMADTIFKMTGRRELIDDISKGIDPHGAAAVRLGWVDCKPNEVKTLYHTKRQNVKILVYGIPYGKTGFTLGVQLLDEDGNMVGTDEAEIQLNSYIDAQPGLRETLEGIVKEAAYHGYTRSIMGRRRYIKGLNSSKEYVRKKAGNKARNKIQTDAADIVSLAMLRTNTYRWHPKQQWFNSELAKTGSKLVLQVHDELVYEVPEENAEDAAAIIKHEMENSLVGYAPFHAPLKVSGGVTDCWQGGH